jgi:hypothetical protein
VAQVAGQLPNKLKALSSNSSTAKKVNSRFQDGG